MGGTGMIYVCPWHSDCREESGFCPPPPPVSDRQSSSFFITMTTCSWGVESNSNCSPVLISERALYCSVPWGETWVLVGRIWTRGEPGPVTTLWEWKNSITPRCLSSFSWMHKYLVIYSGDIIIICIYIVGMNRFQQSQGLDTASSKNLRT